MIFTNKWGQAPFCTINNGYGGFDESNPYKEKMERMGPGPIFKINQ